VKAKTYRNLEHFLCALFWRLTAFRTHQDVDGTQVGAAVEQLLHQHLAHEPGGTRHEDGAASEELGHLTLWGTHCTVYVATYRNQ